MLFYLVDAIRLNFMVRGRLARGADAVIFDRYIYDELANLSIDDPWVKRYVRLVLKLTPTPGIACLLDADPIQATQRKPEYPLDFVHANRKAYLALSKLEPAIRVIGSASVPEVQDQILNALDQAAMSSVHRPYERFSWHDIVSPTSVMTIRSGSNTNP
jgi:thymidylate kinase